MTAARKARKSPFTQAERRNNRPTRVERRSGSESLMRADRPRMATRAASSTPVERATRRRGRWLPTTHGGAGATTAARIARRHRSPRGPVCSAGKSVRQASLNASASPH
jgi:hypothetical protein